MDPFAEYAAWAYPIALIIAMPMILGGAASWIFKTRYSREARRDHTVFAIAAYCLLAGALAWSFLAGPVEVETFQTLWFATVVAPPLLGAGLILLIPIVSRAKRWKYRISVPSLAAWGVALIVPGLLAMGLVMLQILIVQSGAIL